jgi:VRR-NUC domain
MTTKVLHDDEQIRKPALRISHIVYGREKSGSRVTYLVDPKGGGEQRDIAEEVILKRWRKRVFPGYSFHGDRLYPHCWKTISMVLGNVPLASRMTLSVESINEMRGAASESLGHLRHSLPAPSTMYALIQVCGFERLQLLFERHLQTTDGDPFGTPDLFLFATDRSGRQVMGRFVEVKKPEEPFQKTQKPEIEFLQSLGLHARVLRLIERDATQPAMKNV